jgi:hypothetical protein
MSHPLLNQSISSVLHFGQKTTSSCSAADASIVTGSEVVDSGCLTNVRVISTLKKISMEISYSGNNVEVIKLPTKI